ncbi:PRC-barrel domain containing protein [Alteromonas sp. M12]|uniref:PRC-barrel domain containing protein n=1 Tax=Alteromonas sp. M12 TaxID=3135644 RepID=UPI00319DE184
MYAGLRDIKRFTIAATDGDIGVSQDFLFDDRSWTVRYMYADTHKWLPLGEKVLISPISLRDIDVAAEKIHVKLTMQEVKDSPSIDEHQTVSRAYEALLFKYFGYGYYWTGPGVWGDYAHPTALAKSPQADMQDFEKITDDSIDDNHLRSIDELQGYGIKAKDDTFGQIYDLILDTDNWVIQFIVIDTHDLWPGGRKVLIAPKHIDSINWMEHAVNCHLSVEVIKHCPEFDSELLNDNTYQDKIKQQLATT